MGGDKLRDLAANQHPYPVPRVPSRVVPRRRDGSSSGVARNKLRSSRSRVSDVGLAKMFPEVMCDGGCRTSLSPPLGVCSRPTS